MVEQLVYSVRETGEALKISRHKVYDLIKSGRLQGVKIGRDWRISKESINKFLKGSKDK